jgi:hypothetical protein
MDNVQNCDNYINIPLSEPIDLILNLYSSTNFMNATGNRRRGKLDHVRYLELPLTDSVMLCYVMLCLATPACQRGRVGGIKHAMSPSATIWFLLSDICVKERLE